MANSPSSKKRALQAERRADVNKARRSRMRTFVRKVEEAIAAGERRRRRRGAAPRAARDHAQRQPRRPPQEHRQPQDLAPRRPREGARRLTPPPPAAPAARHSRSPRPTTASGRRVFALHRRASSQQLAMRVLPPPHLADRAMFRLRSRCRSGGLRYCWCHGAIPDRRDFRVKQRILLCRCSIDCDTSVAVQMWPMVRPE